MHQTPALSDENEVKRLVYFGEKNFAICALEESLKSMENKYY